MVTSRHIPDIEDEFSGHPCLEVRASNADVKRYVVGQIGRLAKCVQRDDKLQESIQDEIANAVDGMFLLARLHIESLLDKRTKAKVVLTLDNLTKGSTALEEAYKSVIVRIDGQLPEDSATAKRVLSWISYAQRPMTVQELCHALAVEQGDERLNSDNVSDVGDIVSVCAGLVTVNEENQVIHLVHYTTQKFLERIREQWNPNAQYDIATTCITYLSLKTFKSGTCSTPMEFRSRLAQNVFLDYSARFWSQHIADIQEEVSELAMRFLQDENLVACVLQVFFSLYSIDGSEHEFKPSKVRGWTGLHLVASLGLVSLTRELVSRLVLEAPDLINAKEQSGNTALHLAAISGNTTVMELLIGLDSVDINLVANYFGPYLNSLIEILTGSPYTGELVPTGSRLGYLFAAEDMDTYTPLLMAASKGNLHIVRMLLQTGRIAFDTRHEENFTAIIIAAQHGHKDIVEFLLGTGKFDDRVSAALRRAARNGHQEIVQLLLDTRNADVNAQIGKWTALLWAAMSGHIHVVKLLLSINEIDINLHDCCGMTALHRAISIGHEDIAKLLLSTGKCNVNARDNDGRTALTLAVTQGLKDVVKLLLNTGECKLDQPRAKPILKVAAESGVREIFVMLLEHGATGLNEEDFGGFTALLSAAKSGNMDKVELLIWTGQVDFNAKCDKGFIPLMYAIRGRHVGVARLLLNAEGMDVHRKDLEWLLWVATRNKAEDIVELLIVTGKTKHGDFVNQLQKLAADQGYDDIYALLRSQSDRTEQPPATLIRLPVAPYETNKGHYIPIFHYYGGWEPRDHVRQLKRLRGRYGRTLPSSGNFISWS
ncbi:hypothetical protein NX059_007298 [Plenodomus lindquistii]|nr:hypothetical protein NX059_007298 [Plenodomus lindquistii]